MAGQASPSSQIVPLLILITRGVSASCRSFPRNGLLRTFLNLL